MTQRRRGITLMEVLVAITICGIGLLALLTLFPLGAMEMAQAVKFDRCGHIKHNAAFIANTWDIRHNPQVTAAMLNPLPGTLTDLSAPGILTNPAFAEASSYPVFIDPIGWHANQGNSWQDWVAGQTGSTPRRVTYDLLDPNTSPDPMFKLTNSYYATYSKQQLHRWCVFQDEIDFGNEPTPVAPLTRTPRYSYAYLAQMPKIRNPSLVELTVVLYSGRLLEEPQTGETTYTARYTAGFPIVNITWTTAQAAPEIRMGTWLLETDMVTQPRARFLRSVAVTQTGANSMDVEVLIPPTTTANGRIVVMENVIEVYYRGYD